ncbi:MAG: AMP-binding protein [Nitrospiria bacterium]
MKSPSEQNNLEAEVIEIVRELLKESKADRALSLLTQDASFESDLGLGSLERVELLLRIESAFSISLPDSTIAEVETPRQLARVVRDSGPAKIHRYKQRAILERTTDTVKGTVKIQGRPARTLTEALLRHAEDDPDRPHIYLQSDGNNETTITYASLLHGAKAICNGLIQKGLQRGETVAIMLPTEVSFFHVLFGILLAGGVPVPVYPPFRPDRIEEYAERQVGILGNAEAAFLITFEKIERLAKLLKPRLPALRGVITPEVLEKIDPTSPLPVLPIREADPGLIQYTSGSTGNPKGVFLTHQNLLANIRSMGQAMEIRPGDAGVSWLPLYHDMGLIGAWFYCFYHQIPVTIMPPFTFLSRPERWLWAIHTHRATITAAPNFAYEICARKIRDEAIEGLDLSSWRIGLNGAEPIKPETLTRFTERFAPYGFRPETLLPVYGLAESSVGLTFPKLSQPPRIDKVARERFQRDRKAFPADPTDPSPLEFVGCGVPLPDHEVRIVNDQGHVVEERIEGHIQFRGPSCTDGYYRNPEATQSLFHDGWLVPGDLGYFVDGNLYITGRKKDLIIKGGRNLHPHEMEGIVGEISGIRKGCVVAFGISDKDLGTEKLVIVAETRKTEKPDHADLNKTINERLIATIGMPADRIALVPPGSVPKTSSGKVARAACKTAYEQGRLLRRRRRIQIQLVKLTFSWLWAWGKRAIKALFRGIYGAYLFIVLSLTLIPLWALLSISPKKCVGTLVRNSARLFLRMAGLFPWINGEEHLPEKGTQETPRIWISNHASYADAFFLSAVIPDDLHFLAKKELLKVPVLRTFLQKGAHLLVDRTDVTKGISETDQIAGLLKAGGSVLIFVEGGFQATSGLRPFKLGAFKAAVETSTPICPVTLNGTRQLLRGKTWLPHWRRVTMTIGKPIMPKEDTWRDIVELRDTARKEIARHCGEGTLE